MANIRVKDLDSKASFASDDEILMDSPSGTGTMLRDAFIAAVASQIVAAPSTYKIATLDGANKLTSSQDPSQSVSYLGEHDMVANSPALADGTGTAGDTYYVTNPGTRNYGSGNITAQEGDALVYSGSVWQLVEGIANILDGISTASTARTTLEVNSIDEDAEATATKLVGPALYFDGSNDYVEVSDDAKLSFTDGTDDLPFSVSAWIKSDDYSVEFPIVAKYNTGKEFIFYIQAGDLALNPTDGTYFPLTRTVDDLTSFNGAWVHVCATYEGAGPNSSRAFSDAASGITLYVNGAVQSTSVTNNASYPGMADTTQAVWIGRRGGTYAKGHIKDVKIFNRELTATEVAQLSKGNDLGFADEWGGGTATSGTLTIGKRYRLRDWITGDDFTNVGAGSNADGVEFVATGTTPTTWTNSSVVESIGTLADFRAENFIADKLIDQSSNNFVGTNNGATLVGGRKALQLDTDGAAAGNNVLSIYNGSSHLAYLTDKGDLNANSISSGASTELTIATGAVTATKSYHTIDTESDAASDDLDTISGGRAGQILVVQANNSARSVVLKDGTGNLKLSGDITLDNAEDTATLVSDGTSWYLIATSNNGA